MFGSVSSSTNISDRYMYLFIEHCREHKLDGEDLDLVLGR
jgi:hypothetical protein